MSDVRRLSISPRARMDESTCCSTTTRQLAMEGREHGIRANSISPGLIETNQTREQLKDPAWASAMLGKTLLGRLGRPEEVANLALFLASDESSYVTGVDIVVDAGMRVW